MGIDVRDFCLNKLLKLWYYKLFRMSNGFKRKFQTYLPKFGDRMTLCAQIRMGGDAKEFQEREMNPKNATSIVWPLLRQEFIKNMRPEQYRLFITSDSEDVMTKAVKEFGDQLVTTTGFYIHLDKDRHPKHSCMIRALRLFLDFHLMEQCDKVIISHSGFGIMSVVHGPKSPQIVYFNGTGFTTDHYAYSTCY